jgi:hypothetical protein
MSPFAGRLDSKPVDSRSFPRRLGLGAADLTVIGLIEVLAHAETASGGIQPRGSQAWQRHIRAPRVASTAREMHQVAIESVILLPNG